MTFDWENTYSCTHHFQNTQSATCLLKHRHGVQRQMIYKKLLLFMRQKSQRSMPTALLFQTSIKSNGGVAYWWYWQIWLQFRQQKEMLKRVRVWTWVNHCSSKFSTALETLEAFFHMVASCISNSYVLQTGFELIMCLLTGNCGQIQSSHTPESWELRAWLPQLRGDARR